MMAAFVRSSSVLLAVTAIMAAPSELSEPHHGDSRPTEAARSELWMDPGDVHRRDAFHGPGGRAALPPAATVFEVEDVDTTGYSGGYTVTDPQGRKWDVKTGLEAQPEVVVSRVLWLIGYHQPVVYFVPNWRRKGDEDRPQLSARFRLQSDHRSEGDWAWRDNPFVGTRELNGLVVVNLVLNNWDFKTSNNRIYTLDRAGRGPARWFVVQDLGASLGATGWPIGTRNDVDAFERQRFITMEDGVARIDYRGRHREVLEDLTAADIVWACRLLQRISPQQWVDVFRAAAYSNEVSERYRSHLATKIAEGLSLGSASQVKP